MISVKKYIAIMSISIIVILSLIIGLIIGAVITPGSIVMTKEKIVTEPCEHVNIEDTNVIETSIIYHCDCERPTQRILYNQSTNDTYIYTYYWRTEDGYSHNLYLVETEILKINADGSSEFIK